ncbi:MAG TPA: PKD domain-containing protein [Terriglobales bacterium]|nr:PKD domain-containing protein [Terriglobales bacterium]
MRRTLSLLIVISLASLWATGQVNTINTIAGGGAQSNLATNAYLPQPTSAVRDSAGNTYIAVPALNTVFVVDTGGALTAYAGTGIAGFSGDGGTATKAQLNFPTGLAIDKGNNLFISDQNNERIRRVDASSKNITTVAGSEDPYFGAYGGDGGPATNARLNTPTGIAVDGNGNLFIADTGNAVVRRVDAATQVITTYAGTNPGADVAFGCNSGNAVKNALLEKPTGVAIDGAGNLFVSDTELDVVCKVDASQNISSYAGTLNTPGVPGQNGDGGSATSAQIDRPTGLATDANGNLYITDSGNPSIRKVDTSASHIITTVAGLGTICSNEPGCGDSGPATRASLNFPEGVFIDANNNIVIADTFNMRVRVVSAANATIANLAGGGSGGDGGAATSAVLGLAQSLLVDANENVFALETAGERLRQIDTKGNISTVVGSGFGGATLNCAQPGCNGDSGPATSARFVSPQGVAIDGTGNYYIVDSKAAVVRAINNQAGAITIAGIQIQPGQIATVAGNGTPCTPGSASFPTCGDGGAATSASLDVPVGVGVDAGGNIYISDQALNTVRVVGTTGTITTFAGTPGKACTTYPTNCGDNGVPTSALLNAPAGLAVSPGLIQGVPQPGNTDVFIADSGDNAIRRVSIVSGIALIENISNAAFNGIPTFGGDGGSARSASMEGAQYIAVDNLENLYIGGGFDNVVRRVDAFSGDVSTIAGDVNNLAGGFSGDGGPSTVAMIENTGLALFNTQQGTHDVFIADSGSNRIRKVNLAPISSIFPGSGSTLTFPVTLVGQTNRQPIDLGNLGLDDLVISNLSVSDPTDFNVKPSSGCFGADPPVVVPPTGQLSFCILNFTFAPGPNANGPITATLTFSTNDAANPSLTYTLSGTAAQTTFPLMVTLIPPAGSSAAGGFVASSPFGISCFTQFAGTCTANFAAGSTVTLTASPSSGFNFAGWSGACSGTASCQVLMNQAQNVTATFTPITPAPQMTINIVGFGSGSGTITDSTNAINCAVTNGTASGTCSAQFPGTGTTPVMLTATPTAGNGSSFVGWLGGFCSPYTNPCSISPFPETVALGSVFTGPPQTFAKGQVFLSTDFGMVFVLDSATGKVVQVLSSNPTTGQGEGLTFDAAGNLYMANSQANQVAQFAVNGTVPPTLFGTGYTGPWSPLVQPSGNLLVGQTGHGGDTSVLPTVVQLPQSASATTPPSTTFFPASLNPFTSAYWIELLDSGDIIAYTTGTQTVQVYDLAELAQHPDMITNLHGAFALRELPDDTLLVADTDRIVRIDQSGNILQTYTIPSIEAFFQNLNLDPDGQSFWTNDEFTGVLYRINIQTGAVMNGTGYGTGLGFSGTSGLFTQIGGIAVFGQALSGGADLGVTLSAPAAVNVGANITYSLSVSNAGPLNATGVTLTASIPNSTVVSLSPNTCTSTTTTQGTNISCPIGSLAANGQPVSATFITLPSSPGTITATANVSGIESDPNLAKNTASATTSTGPACSVSVMPNPVPAGLQTTATATCSDAAGTISSTTLDFGDGTPAVNGSTAQHTYSAAGTFTVTVTAIDNLQLTGTGTQVVTVTPNLPPTCALSVVPNSGPAPLSVTVTGNCTAGTSPIASSTTDFGDGTAAQSGTSGTHTYNSPGTFTVTVTATDTNGLSGSKTQTVTVGPAQPPACTLSVVPSTGAAPLNVTATGNCTPGSRPIASTTLDFGDGSATQSGTSGTHKYTTAGTFTVKLTATDTSGLSSTTTQTVTVTPAVAPGCTLTVVPNSGPAPLDVTATGTCTAGTSPIASTTLDFGDGSASQTGTSGTHRYGSTGTFTVRVTATDQNGLSGSATQMVVVSAAQPPACTLVVAPNSGPAPLTVTATGNCTPGSSPITSSTIDFGDGSTAQSGTSGSHTYNSPGTFTVTVTAKDANGLSGSATQTVTVGAAVAPACTLSVVPNSGASPLNVTATGNCTPGSRPLASTTLDFGDGSAAQSGASGTHRYTTAGTFTVKLTATDTSGLSSTATQTVTVTPAVAPACTLTVVPNSGPAPLDVTATGNCTAGTSPIASTTLDFGDGSASQSGTSGTHRYSSAGTFTVKVTATDGNGLTGSATQTVTVAVNQPPSCTLSVAPTSGLAPLPVTATGSCSDPEKALSSTLLDFGDGTTQAAPSGTHTYTKAGTFTVTLTGTDAVGQKATATQTVTVGTNTAPTCTLTVTPTTGIVPLPISATGNCVDAENNIATTVLDFGDGTTANAASGTHTYNAAGTFIVKVTATDALGLSGSASQSVTVTVNNFPQGVFVGISPGTVKRFAPDGTLLQTLTTGLNGTVSGMGFDKAGNLYATDFTAGNVSKFDPKTGTLLGTFGTGFNCQPETIVFDGAGNAYVGQQGCSHQILKFDPSGKLVTTFTVATEEQGSDDIDLSADNCTLLYTSEGLSILRYDVCRNQQLPPFATGLKKALMLRILPDGGVIVADLVDIVRLNASGQQVMTYTAPGDQCLYSITLDQDGTSFWAGDYCSSNIYRFDINSGKQLAKFNSGTPSGTVFGVAISGSGLNVAGLGNAGNITTSPSSASLATGQSATFTVSFTPNAASAGHTLTLSCAGLPVGLACSFNPSTITLGAVGTTTTSTLTITRTTTAELLHPSSPWMLASWMGMVPAIVLVGLRSPRRRRGSVMWLGLIVACTGIWASCGGGGMSKSTTPAPTPQGTYTIIVVGNSGGMQTSTTVNLTVQ